MVGQATSIYLYLCSQQQVDGTNSYSFITAQFIFYLIWLKFEIVDSSVLKLSRKDVYIFYFLYLIFYKLLLIF